MPDPSMNTISQFSHTGMAYSLTLSLLLLQGTRGLWWFLPTAVGLAFWKEFWYDYRYESAEARGSSLEDFLFYLLGIGLAITFFVAHTRL